MQQELITSDGNNFLPTVEIKSVSLMNIIAEAAINPNIDANKISALMDMQFKLMDREKDDLFANDYVKMLAEIPEIEHDKKGDKSTYATFEEINKIVKPVLQKYNFSVSFDFIEKDDKITTMCTLSHSSNRFKQSSICLPIDKIEGTKRSDMQNAISTSSYGKRITLLAILGIVTKGEKDLTYENAKKLTDMQLEVIKSMVNSLPEQRKEDFLKIYSYEKLTKGQFQGLVNKLTKEAKPV